jgi:hypothetical protein
MILYDIKPSFIKNKKKKRNREENVEVYTVNSKQYEGKKAL